MIDRGVLLATVAPRYVPRISGLPAALDHRHRTTLTSITAEGEHMSGKDTEHHAGDGVRRDGAIHAQSRLTQGTRANRTISHFM